MMEYNLVIIKLLSISMVVFTIISVNYVKGLLYLLNIKLEINTFASVLLL